MKPIYLDNHATTPMDPRVLDVMLPFFTEHFGNASSGKHSYGWDAKEAVDQARALVASSIGSMAKEVVFTSGATESNNLAILGAVRAHREKTGRKGKVISALTEHSAVFDACKVLEKEGHNVVLIAPGEDGIVSPERLAEHLDDDTCLVSLMAVNNEVGVIHPIAGLAALCNEHGVLFHTDATQALGRICVDVETWQVDLLSITGHKIYGPKGCGALFVRRKPKVQLAPLSFGGRQERGLRSGTLNVPGIVGLGKAAELAKADLDVDNHKISAMRDVLWQEVSSLPGVHFNGHRELRVCGNLNLFLEGIDADKLLLKIHKEVACSAGSACSSKNPSPSHVLRGLNLGNDRARSSIRLGIGRMNTHNEVNRAAKILKKTIQEMRDGGQHASQEYQIGEDCEL
ncbi:MAG: cysteine desulfurase [Deltaproteobacteria bacterium]|nr:cysteine desulfurase [Deltaproteobacteria bacterium]